MAQTVAQTLNHNCQAMIFKHRKSTFSAAIPFSGAVCSSHHHSVLQADLGARTELMSVLKVFWYWHDGQQKCPVPKGLTLREREQTGKELPWLPCTGRSCVPYLPYDQSLNPTQNILPCNCTPTFLLRLIRASVELLHAPSCVSLSLELILKGDWCHSSRKEFHIKENQREQLKFQRDRGKKKQVPWNYRFVPSLLSQTPENALLKDMTNCTMLPVGYTGSGPPQERTQHWSGNQLHQMRISQSEKELFYSIAYHH